MERYKTHLFKITRITLRSTFDFIFAKQVTTSNVMNVWGHILPKLDIYLDLVHRKAKINSLSPNDANLQMVASPSR